MRYENLLLYLQQLGTSLPSLSRDPWPYLQHFTNVSYVKSYLNDRHGRAPNTSNAREVADNMAQAISYFDSSVSASPITKPLLQYYGFRSLARTIVLCADHNTREATLKPSHGLQFGNEITSALALKDVTLKVSTGLFSELWSATQNTERATVGLMDRGWAPYTQRLKGPLGTGDLAGTSLRFRTLLNNLPDCYPLLEAVSETAPNIYPVKMRLFGDIDSDFWQVDFYVMNVNGRDQQAFLDEFKTILNFPAEIEIQPHPFHYTVGGVPGLEFRLFHGNSIEVDSLNKITFKNDMNGISFIVPESKPDPPLSSLCSYFAVSFLLGSLVRYYPSIWGNISRGQEKDKLSAIIPNLTNLIQTLAPELALQELSQTSPFSSTYPMEYHHAVKRWGYSNE